MPKNAIDVAIGVKRHAVLHCICLLLTQSGHRNCHYLCECYASPTLRPSTKKSEGGAAVLLAPSCICRSSPLHADPLTFTLFYAAVTAMVFGGIGVLWCTLQFLITY